MGGKGLAEPELRQGSRPGRRALAILPKGSDSSQQAAIDKDSPIPAANAKTETQRIGGSQSQDRAGSNPKDQATRIPTRTKGIGCGKDYPKGRTRIGGPIGQWYLWRY